MRTVLCAFWISITVGNLDAQNIEQTIQLAERAFFDSRYDEAASLYGRVLFFDKEGIYDSVAVKGLAWSSYFIADYEQSAKYFKTLSYMNENSAYEVMNILSLIKSRQLLNAKRSALSMATPNETDRVNRFVLLGLIDFQLRNFDQSKVNFNKVCAIHKMDSSFEKSIFSEAAKVNRKSKMKAIIFSAIIPGTGHFYSGHFKEGLNSFIVISAFGAAYAYTIINFGLVDALLSISPWFQRYYVGGLNTAADLVDEYKEERFIILYNRLTQNYGELIQVEFHQ